MKAKIFFIFTCLLTSITLWGADERPEMTGSASSLERWYRIELLIYKQKSAPDAIEEVWPHEISLSYPTNWVRLKSQEEYIANPHPHPVLASWLSRIKTSPYTPFVLQGDSTKNFSKAVKQIQRFEGDVLFHGVWWQPFIQNDTRESPAILIKAGKRYGDHAELEGSINFKLSRYLHISTNLWLSEFAGSFTEIWPTLPLPPDQIPLILTDDALQEADLILSSKPVVSDDFFPSEVVLIRQSRRMRSEETHYIDHPKLGIVVRLTPHTER